MKVRVLVVEDQHLFRKGLCLQLSAHPEIEVVGDASTGKEAVFLAHKFDPDVVLMDIELGSEPNGIVAGQTIKSASPATGIVLLSGHNNRHYLATVEQAGGWSYLLKSNVRNMDTLIDAIQGSLWGKVIVDPQLIAGLQPRSGSFLGRLSPTQLKIVQLVAEGYTDDAVAQLVDLDDARSVRARLDQIYELLEISPLGGDSRVHAVLAYIEQARTS